MRPHLFGWAWLVAMPVLLAPVASEAACQMTSGSQGGMEYFVEAPQSLLASHPRGGLPMTYQVHAIATASPATLKALTGIIPRASATQKQSIGEGLARGALGCSARNQDITRRIQDAVRQTGDSDVMRAFARYISNESAVGLRPVDMGNSDAARQRMRGTSLDLKDPRKPLSIGDPFAPIR